MREPFAHAVRSYRFKAPAVARVFKAPAMELVSVAQQAGRLVKREAHQPGKCQ